LLLAVLMCLGASARAQEGRHELPLDTVPIGGDEQKMKEEKMEAHDQLTTDLVNLRDSISAKLSSASSQANAMQNETLRKKKSELDELIKAMKRTDRDAQLMRKGQLLLQEARRHLKE